ncbi:hypothetical protein ACPCAJ_34585 [Streptomyces griseoincarnatus]
MPEGDALKDTTTKCDLPGAMTGTGEIRNGFAHLHVVMGVEGDRATAGHPTKRTSAPTSRAYVIPVT